MNTQQFKTISRNIERLVNQKAPGSLSHSDVMEVLAKAMGYRSYQGCKASLEDPSKRQEYSTLELTIKAGKEQFQKMFAQKDMKIDRLLGPVSHKIHYVNETTTVLTFDTTNMNADFILDEYLGSCFDSVEVIVTASSCSHESLSERKMLHEKIVSSLSGKKLTHAELEENFPEIAALTKHVASGQTFPTVK